MVRSGAQPTCTFALTAATRASVTFRVTPHWGDPRQTKSVTDPQKLYGPLKGYTYGPWLDGSKFDGGAEAVASATNVKTGSLSYVSVYRCSVPAGNPEPCVLASSPLTATTLAGQRVYTYLLGRGTGVLRRLTGNPYFYDIIINASDSRDAINIMSQLNRVDR